jgi:hypothetical protein
VLYINDGCIVGLPKERTIARYKFSLDTLKKVGLLVSIEKSSAPEDASQQMKYLGVIIDSSEMCILAPEEKIYLLRALIKKVIKLRRSMPVKDLDSVIGKLVSLEPAFGARFLIGMPIV